MDRVLIAGCGYVGCRLAELLVAEGCATWGLRRRPSGLPAGVEGVAADVRDAGTLRGLPSGARALVYAVSPGGRTEEAYRAAYVDGLRNVLRALGGAGAGLERVVLVTSTAVYGQRDGQWVDEDTPTDPADPTGRILLEAEAVASAEAEVGIALRLGGIYGPGRSLTVRRVLDGEAGCPEPARYGNRIHRDDAAGAIRHLLSLPDPSPVYVGVDRDPAPLRDVYRWIAERAGVPGPCDAAGAADEEPSGRRGTNKRCSSGRLVDSGYVFRYPSYREGYAPLIDALSGASPHPARGDR